VLISMEMKKTQKMNGVIRGCILLLV